MSPFRLLLLATCLGLAAGVIVGDRQNKAHDVSAPCLEFQMRSSRAGRGQILVDYGDGHNERDSTSFTVHAGEEFVAYCVPFPRESGAVRNIRLDPIEHTAELVIRNPRLLEPNSPPRDVPLSRFKPVQEVQTAVYAGTDLHLTVPEPAHDPIVLIEETLGTSDILSGTGHNDRAESLPSRWKVGFLALAFVCMWLLRFPDAMQRLTASVTRRFASSSTAKIVGCAVAGSTVASYAVIFFGMSVVSPPLIGSLYSRSPWVPGFDHSGPVETIAGNDVGASYWTTLPNAAAQYESIFVWHEFPFWNRYVGGGIPLYAQGQSMIGDPLHLLCVVSKGSSWGWDAKIIIEKCLFSVGVGLVVRNLTASVTSGMLLAVAANFLGFHIWRLNHPAIFVITYCPWLLLAWMRLGHAFTENPMRLKKGVRLALTVAALAFIQLNSGATKEAVITAAYTNALGMALFAIRISETYSRSFVMSAVGVAGLTVAFCTAPYWLIFLDALSKSYTIYSPSANSLWGQSPLLFFEPFFLIPVGSLMGFANLPVLLAAVVGLLSLRRQRPAAKIAVAITAGGAIGVAFGVIPESMLVRIPLVQGINHIGNTFSVAAITPVLLLAGYGVADLIAEPSQRRRSLILSAGLVVGVLLLHWVVVYVSSKPLQLDDVGKSEATAAIMVLAGVTTTLAGLWGALLCGVTRPRSVWAWAAAALCAAPLLLRCTVHPMSGVANLDNGRRVVNAYPRVDYEKRSEAIEFMRNIQWSNDSPSRVIGEGTVLFPGFNIRYLLEGVVPVEPLRSGFVDRLLDVLDYPDMGWGWLKLIAHSQMDSRAIILDMLNVGYVLAMPDVEMPSGMELVCSADLNVWKRLTVWPRAFFTTTILPVGTDAEFVNVAKTTPPPFAIVSVDDATRFAKSPPGRSCPGRSYQLTANSTSFTVDADSAGIIVIHESYYPGDFIARLNGRVVDYIKVNGAFKGIPVSGPGTYRVSFQYRPAKLGISIALALVGFGLCVAGAAFVTRGQNSQAYGSPLARGLPALLDSPLCAATRSTATGDAHRHGPIEALLPSEFDAHYYRFNNPDIAHWADNDLAFHYDQHGRAEGRPASAGQTRASHIELFCDGYDCLEIGPFDCPLLTGPRVRYFDVMGQAELKARAADLGRHHGRTPQIDFVSAHGDLSIVGDATFDVVLSAHVVEHQPDLVGHFSHVARILRPGGVYVVIVPDKRYCFDHFIRETTIADIVDAHVTSTGVHTLKSVIEHRALTCHNDCVQHWNGNHGSPRISPSVVRSAVMEYRNAMGGYVDVHAWQFYPHQFRKLMELLSELRLLSLKPIRVYETPRGTNEFVAILERSSIAD